MYIEGFRGGGSFKCYVSKQGKRSLQMYFSGVDNEYKITKYGPKKYYKLLFSTKYKAQALIKLNEFMEKYNIKYDDWDMRLKSVGLK